MSLTQNIHTRKLIYNNFNLSHTVDTSGRIGKLIPVQAMPVVAGDLVDQKIEFNIRLAPLSAPAMARFNVHFHSFYVPYRILTPRNGQESTWEKFVLGIGSPLEDVATLPYFTANGTYSINEVADNDDPSLVQANQIAIGSLWDYLQLPVFDHADYGGTFQFMVNEKTLGEKGILALNHLAYLKIWNDWYRRDQIEPEVVFPLNLGKIDLEDWTNSDFVEPENPVNVDTDFDISSFCSELMKLRTRNYERDYFTSALPEPQFGDDVFVGGGDLSAMANAYLSLSTFEQDGIPVTLKTFGNVGSSQVNAIYSTSGLLRPNGISNNDNYLQFSDPNNIGEFNVKDIYGLQATPFSINELRLAMQIQGVREKINRGGTRYIEIMKSIFGVSVSDLRLQRPQYLGGIKAPISIGAVLQTSESASTPQGTMTGQGGSVGGERIFRTKRIFEEAGVVMTIMSITPRTGYYGGVPRQYMKFDPVDYYTPDFDHLGEQETFRSELAFKFGFGGNPDDDLTNVDKHFGYNPRYEEYKASYSTSTGEFRTTLSNWHVNRSFNELPVLSSDFIHAEPEDFDRLFEFQNIANTSNEHFYAQIYLNVHAKRPMSKYSTPFTFF